MHGDNKRVKDSESLIVQYDDHYADIPLARINEAETLDDYILLPVIDHRQYDHSTHVRTIVLNLWYIRCVIVNTISITIAYEAICNERKHESVSEPQLSNYVSYRSDVSRDKYTFIDLFILFSFYD